MCSVDCFGDTVKDTFQVIQLTRILNLYYDDFAFAVFGFDIHGLNLSSTLCWLLSLSSSSMIFTSSPKRTVKNPSSTSKFAFDGEGILRLSQTVYICPAAPYPIFFDYCKVTIFFRLYYFSTQKTKSLLLLSYTASVYRFGWLIIMTVGYWIKLHLSFITLYSLVLAGEGQVLHLSFRDYCCKLLFFSFEIIKGILFVFGSQLSFFLVNPNLFILCVLLITYMIIVCHICDKYLSLLR